MIATIPDFTNPNEVLISFLDDKADEQGRRRFCAMWLDTNTGPTKDEHGVRGQVFFTNVNNFTTRTINDGRTVRLLGALATAGDTEPSHHCPACDIDLWASDDRDMYRECPQCGEEASPIRYCPECDTPNCNYHNH